MHELLAGLLNGVALSGDVSRDVGIFLAHHGSADTAAHCADVAAEAARLASRFGGDMARAELAGWLHDVSKPVPVDRRAEIARAYGAEVLAEEEGFPPILHQKLSAILAHEIFSVTDPLVLSAIRCHTTLQADASLLDKIVFVADKVAWDQPGDPPYQAELLAALECSLDEGALCYLSYLWSRRHTLRTVHPWMVAAYRHLSSAVPTPHAENRTGPT